MVDKNVVQLLLPAFLDTPRTNIYLAGPQSCDGACRD